MPPPERRRRLSQHLLSWAPALLAVCALAAVAVWLSRRLTVAEIVAWVDAMGPSAPVLFVAITALAVVLLLPGVVFTLSGGFLFGPLLGTVCIVTGTSLGATGAFLLARYVLSETTARFMRKHSRLARVDAAIAGTGWTFVLLTRLVPFFPFRLSNYFFGVSAFTLRDFCIGTAIGIVPYSALNVYAGSLAADLAAHDWSTSPSWARWSVSLAVLLIGACALFLLARLARSALERVERGD